MRLESKVPRVVAKHQSRHFHVGEDRDPVALLPVSLAGRLGDNILPSVKEIRASGAVGDDHVRVERLHAFELLVGVGDGVASVALYEVLAETEAAAVPALRIVYDLTTPRLDHSDEDVRVFSAPDSL